MLLVLIIIYQDEYRKRILAKKSAKLNRFWNKGKDRRKTLRLNTELDVLYEVVSGNTAQKQLSMSRNISLGGINLALNEKLLPETILDLQLNIPNSTRSVFVQGKIVWVKEISKRFIKQKEQRLFATGIKFTRMKPNDETTLHNFINGKIKGGQEQEQPRNSLRKDATLTREAQ